MTLANGKGREYKGAMSLVASLAAVKATLETGKIVRDLIQQPKVDAHAVEAHLHEMLVHLNNVYSSLVDARVEMDELRTAADTRAAKKVLDDDMAFQVDGGYYIKQSEKEKGLIAYCPLCWKDNDKTVPLHAQSIPGCFQCSIHKTEYKTAKGREGTSEFWRTLNDNPRRGRGGPNSWMG
jgi:hypothetical protein